MDEFEFSESSQDAERKNSAFQKFPVIDWWKVGDNRHVNGFLVSHTALLGVTYSLPDIAESSESEKNIQRTKKSFEDCCEKSKKWKIQNLLDTTSPHEIIKASELVLRKMGKLEAANIVTDLSEASSSKGKALLKI